LEKNKTLMNDNANILLHKISIAQKSWADKYIVLIFFFVVVRLNFLISSPGCNTLSPKLTCDSIFKNGDVKLTWSSPPSMINFNSYQIYQASSFSGPYTLVDSVFSFNQTSDTIIGANAANGATLFYYIQTRCVGNTYSTAIDTISTIDPPLVVSDTLSLDNNNRAVLSWNKSPSVNANGYVIYTYNGVSWIPIKTLLGINNTFFIDSSSTVNSGSQLYYTVAVVNTCGNILPYNQPYSTIYLTPSANICKRSVNLKWTGNKATKSTFISMTGLAKYLIYQSTVGIVGPYSLVATVPADTLSYTVTGLAPKTTYYFKVMAMDSSGTKTSTSNRIIFYSATPQPPKYLYLRSASVVASNQIDVTCHVDVAASISNYKIFRATDVGTIPPVYSQIGTLQPSNVTPITFSDVNINPNKYSYYYKIMIVDSCGFDGMETNVGHTILLSASGKSIIQQNYLRWTAYSEWQNGVSFYNIYRGIDGVIDPTPIANVPPDPSGITTYTDDVSEVLSGSGIFNYYIEAVEANGNLYGFIDQSLSNVAEAYQDPLIYIPNAFVPEGFNKIFKPVLTYVNYSEYEFTVFDRWGGVIFSTSNVDEGWDGTYKGKNLGNGVYVYMIKIKTSRGDYQTLKGTITLID